MRFARALFALAALSLSSGAHAQGDYPNKPITILCWSEPGSPVDYYARIMARLLRPCESTNRQRA